MIGVEQPAGKLETATIPYSSWNGLDLAHRIHALAGIDVDTGQEAVGVVPDRAPWVLTHRSLPTLIMPLGHTEGVHVVQGDGHGIDALVDLGRACP